MSLSAHVLTHLPMRNFNSNVAFQCSEYLPNISFYIILHLSKENKHIIYSSNVYKKNTVHSSNKNIYPLKINL